MGVLSLMIGIILGIVAVWIEQVIANRTSYNNSLAQNLRTETALKQALGACRARDLQISNVRAQVLQIMDRGEAFPGQLAKKQAELNQLRATAQAIPEGRLWADLLETERQGRDLRTYQPFRNLSFSISRIRWNLFFTILGLVQLFAQIRAWRLSVINAEQAARQAIATPCNSGSNVSPNNLRLIENALEEIQ